MDFERRRTVAERAPSCRRIQETFYVKTFLSMNEIETNPANTSKKDEHIDRAAASELRKLKGKSSPNRLGNVST